MVFCSIYGQGTRSHPAKRKTSSVRGGTTAVIEDRQLGDYPEPIPPIPAKERDVDAFQEQRRPGWATSIKHCCHNSGNCWYYCWNKKKLCSCRFVLLFTLSDVSILAVYDRVTLNKIRVQIRIRFFRTGSADPDPVKLGPDPQHFFVHKNCWGEISREISTWERHFYLKTVPKGSDHLT